MPKFTIPNAHCPADQMLFRIMGNEYVPGLFEATMFDPLNQGLADKGPFPPRASVFDYTRPTPADLAQLAAQDKVITLFD